jgi:hypothetical protein
VSDHTERCEFVSVRSRFTWVLIGGWSIVLFLGLTIFVLVKPAKEDGNQVAALVIGIAGALCGLAIVVNALRAGHVILSRDQLIYRSVFRNRRLKRADVRKAYNGEYTPPNNNRRFNVPFIELSSGRSIRLTDFATPVGVDQPALDSHIWLDGSDEKSTESLYGLVAWIDSWANSQDWIADSSGLGESTY